MKRTLIGLFFAALMVSACQPATGSLPTQPLAAPGLIQTLTQGPTGTSSTPTQTIVPASPTPIAPKSTLAGFEGISAPDPAHLTQVALSYATAVGIASDAVQVEYRKVSSQSGDSYLMAMTADGTPLLMTPLKMGEKTEWQPATLRAVANLAGLEAGISVDGAEDYQNPLYQAAVVDHFNLIMPDGSFAANSVSKWGDQFAVEFTGWAEQNQMRLRILSAFHVTDVPFWGEIKTPAQADAFMRTRLETLMAPKFITPGMKTELVVAHESTVQDWGDGTEHWVGEGADKGLLANPLWNVYGKEWPVKVYIMAYQVAKEKGLKIGEDIVFALSDYDFLQNTAKADMVLRMMTRIRNGVAAETSLGLKPEDVHINIIDQTHLFADANNQRGWKGIYTKDIRPDVIAANAKKLSVYGDIEGNEIDISGTTDMAEKAEATAALVDAYLKAGVTSLDFYQALRFDPQKK